MQQQNLIVNCSKCGRELLPHYYRNNCDKPESADGGSRQAEKLVRLKPPDDVMEELTNKTIETLYGKIEVLVLDTLKENEIQIVDMQDLMKTTRFCEFEDGTKILEHNGKPLLELYPVKHEEINGNLIVSQKYRRLST